MKARNVISFVTAIIFAIVAVVMIIAKFAWLALIPIAFMSIAFICYFAFKRQDAINADEYQDAKAGKTYFWHMIASIILLVLSILLVAIYAMFGSMLKDFKNFGTLVVDTLVVNKDAEVKGDLIVEGDSTVRGNQTVEGDQTVKGNQTVEKDQTVKGNQTVEGDQIVKGNQTVEGDSTVKGDLNVKGDVNVDGDLNVKGNVNTPSTPSKPSTPSTPSTPSKPNNDNKQDNSSKDNTSKPDDSSKPNPTPDPKPDEPTPVTPKISAPSSIRYGETVYVNLEGIKASDLLVSNKRFVKVDRISDTRVAITLTEDVDGYITITDSVSRVNVVIDIVA